jgi:hypothetical protein
MIKVVPDLASASANQSAKFPKLMMSICGSKEIVFMVKEKTGVVIFSEPSSEYRIGYCGASWNMNVFKDYDEQITLKNVID